LMSRIKSWHMLRNYFTCERKNNKKQIHITRKQRTPIGCPLFLDVVARRRSCTLAAKQSSFEVKYLIKQEIASG
jgi:hypothetical protein